MSIETGTQPYRQEGWSWKGMAFDCCDLAMHSVSMKRAPFRMGRIGGCLKYQATNRLNGKILP